MKTILAAFSTALILIWVMGTFDIIDFKFCIAPAGTCSVEVRK
jgi:hypothetical protein